MCPRPIVRARGFAVASAIFILVVLAALAAAIVSISSSQQISSAIDYQGSRAYWAARSAAEWGLKQLLLPDETAAARSFSNCMAVPQNFPVATGFTVQITNCIRDPAVGNFSDSGQQVVVYTVTAMASAGVLGSATYVEREVSVSAAMCLNAAATLADGATLDPWQRCN
jgi:MSHA biogenesis protein MshP